MNVTSRVRLSNSRRDDEGEYVGRPTPLGNPFVMRDESERDEVCDKYARWFAQMLVEQPPNVMNQLLSLREKLRLQGVLTLRCWCAPKRCHAESIKQWLEGGS